MHKGKYVIMFLFFKSIHWIVPLLISSLLFWRKQNFPHEHHDFNLKLNDKWCMHVGVRSLIRFKVNSSHWYTLRETSENLEISQNAFFNNLLKYPEISGNLRIPRNATIVLLAMLFTLSRLPLLPSDFF